MIPRSTLLIICWAPIATLSLGLGFGGCVQVKTDPIRIEPIYIEITINHRIQRELEDIFADIDRESATMEYRPLELEEPQP
jgi:hypothetical protein